MRVLDNLLSSVIGPWKANPHVDFVHICPIRRDIRESHVNMWDSTPETYRDNFWGKGQLEQLATFQNKLDLDDLKIVKALNDKKPGQGDVRLSGALPKFPVSNPKKWRKGFCQPCRAKTDYCPVGLPEFRKARIIASHVCSPYVPGPHRAIAKLKLSMSSPQSPNSIWSKNSPIPFMTRYFLPIIRSRILTLYARSSGDMQKLKP